KIRPLLADHCYQCHGEEEQESGLRVDSLTGLLSGGEGYGPAIVPGDPDGSMLIDAVKHQEIQMPPDKKLSAGQIADLTNWVKMGAPWPGSTADLAEASEKETFVLTDEHRSWWSFLPIVRPEVPGLAADYDNAIDRFVIQRLEAAGLSPAKEASRRELIRRATYDLIGLPPTPEEVRQFVADDSPDAYERLIDRLLASSQYGERWARHWLDLVRYAQTNGYERDDEKPFAWRYRDYVIRAFNEDKPFDQFVLEQLAGDELEEVTDDSVIATAFYRFGVWDDEPDDIHQAAFDGYDDILATTGSAFMGLTIGCARCHEHKFDPIPQEDYYRMLAFIRNVNYYLKPEGEQAKTVVVPMPGGKKTLGVTERGAKPRPTHVLLRGRAATPGDEVQPRFPQVLASSLSATVPEIPKLRSNSEHSTGRRLALARWIASPQNPLTARVIANRLWHHHFGRGIVATPSDFGKTGIPPTHPELLDWLASELIEGDWHLKSLHKKIMMSKTYRQSSAADQEKALRENPENTLLWRQNVRRLEAEAVRDAILAVSGQLNLETGGPGFYPQLPA
ncbi:MAG: PSD1 and planctomycete cytochrome C domain-containing protein, partial [Planctomycetales bacterium]